MKVDSRQPEFDLSLRPYSQNWLDSAELELQTGTWVQLQELPTPYSYDEALLLCQNSATEWVVWIPDYGETILNQSQFCRNT